MTRPTVRLTRLTVDNLSITMAGASAWKPTLIRPAPTNPVVVTVQNGTAISGAVTGVLVDGAMASAKVINSSVSAAARSASKSVSAKPFSKTNNLVGQATAVSWPATAPP